MAEGLRIAVLGNAKSGRGVRQAWDCPHAYTQDLDEALDVLRGFGPLDVLGIHGGDGTLDLAIGLMRRHRIFEREPAIALLKGGTTNMTWRDVGVRHLPVAGFATRERNVMKVEAEGMDPQYGFFFGLGAVPRAIERFNDKGRSGVLAESAAIGALFWRLLTGRAEGHTVLDPVSVNGEKTVLLTLATLERLLLGMNPAPPGSGMGCVQLRAPYRGLWRVLPRMLGDAGYVPSSGCGMARFVKDTMHLAFDGGWTLDGELFEASCDAPLTVSLDTPVRFVVT